VADNAFDVRGQGDPASVSPGGTLLRWPLTPGHTDSLKVDLGWWAGSLGTVPDPALDLLRIAGAAYAADRLTPRGTGFTRTISLTVAVTGTQRWENGVADDVADLLRWLTGDRWLLSLVPDQERIDEDVLNTESDEEAVSLLSGGLDSFLGAIHLQARGSMVRFVGHIDSATAVSFHQDKVQAWLGRAYNPAPAYTRFHLNQQGKKQEGSSRSRSLMFMAMGIAVASSQNSEANTLYVPENGYTSLNIPLHANRAGALSTRSTHPETFARMHRLLGLLGLAVSISNPFEWMTKGEAMTAVAATTPPDGWIDAAAQTISCSKLDSRTFKGGNQNLNCGYCLACLVRRATFLSAGITDKTIYLPDTLTAGNKAKLIAKRRGDIDAVRYAIEVGVDDDAIDSSTWPDDYDLDAASDLVQRGLDELAALPLP
jgi:7-cyano-7-deazaguanine synthase in queuosine biosynthesis